MNNKKLVFIICLSVWTIITLLRVVFHQPWHDEANAWELARNFHWGSILDNLKYEGHFFVWYFLILPFAKLDLFYPYSMLLINWGFCLGAIYLLWKKFPFNNAVKALITFSFPFLACYPVIARCYSVGIFLLFALAAMYRDRLKHPVIYSIFIFFCANTSLMALIGAFLFGSFLIYDLFKEKQFKDFKICFGIAVLSVVTFIVQTLNVDLSNIPEAKLAGYGLNKVLSSFTLFTPAVNAIFLLIFLFGFGLIFFKDKRIFSFLALIYAFLLYFFNFWYSGDFWHHYFFFIYLICACWIFADNCTISSKLKNLLTILLCILSFILVFDFRYETVFFNSKSKVIADYIKNHQNIHHIFINRVFLMSLPYLHNSNSDIVLIQSENTNYDIYFNFDDIKNAMITSDKNKGNYLYVNTCSPIPDLRKGNEILKFELKENIDNIYCIYKIDIITDNRKP
ncbi:hypothetical protein IJ818_02545 [bacterium]|nr:hypothetical protein [bacterium]